MSHGRGHIPELSDAETKDLQRLLVKRGYDVGKIDGLVGEKTRAAVKEMQLKYKMPADSYPTPELLVGAAPRAADQRCHSRACPENPSCKRFRCQMGH